MVANDISSFKILLSFFSVTSGKNVLGCGIKRQPPQILIKYEHLGKKRLHLVNVRGVTHSESINDTLNEIYGKPHHIELLNQVPKAQIVRLISILVDVRKGIPLTKSLEINNELERISSEEDLNKVDDKVIERKKVVMNELFETNRKRPGDPGYRYDVAVEFPNQIESSGWDSDISEF